MKVIDCQQGSSEWFRARCGVVTASEIDALVTPEFKARAGDGVRTYLCQKVAEKVMGFNPAELTGTPSWAADQGKILETLAVPWFEFTTGRSVQRVGFCMSDDGRTGCSPDGLLGDDEGLEVKCPQPSQHVRYLLDGSVPKQYLPQVHFSMLVTGRKFWTFVSYERSLPKLTVRINRDEEICAKLQAAVAAFLKDYDAALARLREMGDL